MADDGKRASSVSAPPGTPEELYRLLFENTGIGMMFVDEDTTISLVNKEFEKQTGYSKEAVEGKMSWTAFVVGDELLEQMKTFHQLRRVDPSLAPPVYDARMRDAAGAVRDVTLRVVIIPGTKNSLVSLIDVTEKKRAEEAIRESEGKFRSLVENMQDTLYRCDREGTITYVSPSAARLWGGGAPEKMIGKNIAADFYYRPEERELLLEKLRQDGRVREFEVTLRRADGTSLEVATNSHFYYDAQGNVLGVEGIFTDITARKAAERTLREGEERLRGIAANLPGVVFQFTATDAGEYALSYVSERVTELFDIRLPLGELFPAFVAMIHEEDRPRFFASVRKSVAELSPWSFEGRVLHPSGRALWIHGLATPARHGDTVVSSGILLDVTEKRLLEEERRKLEHQLSQSQKMDAIGQLAGGVAHDFNNILTGIRGNVYMMLRDHDPAHPHYQRLHQIEEHVVRGANLTRQLLGFAREGKYELRIWPVNELVRRTTQLFLETRKEIDAEMRLAEDAYAVEADAGQIEQVLLNLYINAGHAMPGGGHLTIETTNVVLGEADARGFEAKPGRYVRISITDTGIGMDQETLKRIFEPFFTTKADKGGTGLGLPSAYGIIRNHGGVLNAYSEPGRGTTMNILLPPSGREAEEEAPAPARAPVVGSGTVLLVDDEPVILSTAAAMLEELGYAVVRAGGGREAVEAYRERAGEIDLVILDMVMPGMGGSRVLREILAIEPRAKIILSSGYGLQGEVRELMGAGCRAFIQKPYTFAELSRIVGEVLAQPARDGA